MSDPTNNQQNAQHRLIDLRQADANYNPIPRFAEWKVEPINSARWDRYMARLEGLRNTSADALQRAYRSIRRAAAIDTGALEALYEVDRGFTFTVAMQAATWEEQLNKKGAEARRMIETQIEVYDQLLDFVTGKQPIVPAWIRELHAELTAAQETYQVHTEVGWQKHRLAGGEYKSLPNHVLTSDDTIHSYAPVDMVPTEMHRLCQEFTTPEFLGAHPALQAAYAHYAFVCIHPFADGNGRVARALASVFTYRAARVPVLILSDHRPEYLHALRIADSGTPNPFADFILQRTLDSMQLVQESLKEIEQEPIEQSAQQLYSLFQTKGGFTHAEVDGAAYSLMELLERELNKTAVEFNRPNQIQIRTEAQRSNDYQPSNELLRLPVTNRGRQLLIHASTFAPATASITYTMFVEVPKDCDTEDDIIVRDEEHQIIFEARMAELVPHASVVVQLRAGMTARRVITRLLTELRQHAEQKLRTTGY